MISGFVILGTLEKTTSTKKFVVARFSRLYPVYWIAILLTVLITSLFANPAQKDMYTVNQILVNLTMLQSFFKIKDVDGVYWTLAIELVFYFWMWLFFRLKKLKSIEWICFGWMMACLLSYMSDMSFKKYLNVLLIVEYAPLFIAGMLFYQLKKGKRGIGLHLLIAASLVIKLYFQHTSAPLYSLVNSKFIPDIIIILFYITFYLLTAERLTFLSGRTLIFLGTISYPLYLIHENIGNTVIYWLRRLVDEQLFYVPVTIVLVIAMAYVIHLYIEKPVMKKIRHYFDAKENTAKASAVTSS